MNNEPVAWMELYYGEPNNIAWTNAELKDSGEIYKTVPLYIHPTKTLTNEEILCLWDWWSGEILATDILDFADTYKRVLLGEEGLLEWHQEYVKRMNNETT